MPDLKISQLPVASTPLAGTELVPIVQGGVTDQTTVQAIMTSTVPSGTANGVLYLNASKVATSGSALVFDGSNLGMGVTPSAWQANGKALEFSAGAIYSYLSGASGEFDYAYNAYFDGSWKYKASSSAASLYSIQAGVYKWFTAPSGTAGNAISFTQAMTLDASGNLLVGTTANTYLDKAVINGGLTILDSQLNVAAGTSGVTPFEFVNRVGGGFTWYVNNATNQAMTLDSSGNLGLGVTPSAWSQGKGFEVLNAGYGLWNGSGSPASIYMTANAYFNGGWKYGGTGQASHYYQYLGQHIWSTAASGTAGNTISFTQAMTLDASGNLLVGKTTTFGDEIAAFYESANGTRYVYIENPNTGTSAAAALNVNAGSGGDLRLLAYGANHSTQANNASLFNHKLTGSLLFGTEGTERARINSSGDFLTLLQTAAPTLSTNNQMVFTLTSNTNLRISVRGSDGVTRVTNLTLA